ncbi:MAG: F0F1 ATP synthase subunit epsilon [Chlorobiales bacterium]|nr:F0F1 ATP synthase subunit epsilon [Chlorobiales bacterium]
MADTLQFELVAPEKLIFSGDVEMVVVPGTEGDFGVLPGHALLISTLRPGVIEIYENEKPKDRYVVGGGFSEVTGERCTVLSTEAFDMSAIDRTQAQQRLEQAQLGLRDAADDEERERYEREIELAELLAANAS